VRSLGDQGFRSDFAHESVSSVFAIKAQFSLDFSLSGTAAAFFLPVVRLPGGAAIYAGLSPT
jgi:hypothetical protein